MLGKRIREIRKHRKMTLEALAGEGLTKGMLSLIENNKAKPSMESLAYIAERLGVEVTELLEDVSSQKLREVLDEAEKLYNQDDEKVQDKYKQLIELIEPYIGGLPKGYVPARLLDLYSRSLYREKRDRWQELSIKAAKAYDEINLTAQRASIGIFWALVEFLKHEYSESLKIILRERKHIELNHHFIDPMTRVDLDYQEAILHFAVGDSEAATVVMENAIQFSKEHRIFYRIDDLYRLAAAQALISKNTEQQNHYVAKLKQYGEFAEHHPSIMFCDLFKIMSLIEQKHDYQGALEIIDFYLTDPKTDEDYRFWIRHEKGKALYGLGRYHEALTCLEKAEIPAYAHHPFDLSLLYMKDSYKALCHMELGNQKQALAAARVAVEHYKPMPHTPYKDFANETYKKVSETM